MVARKGYGDDVTWEYQLDEPRIDIHTAEAKRPLVTARLTDWLPRFLYFDSYDRLPGRISLEALQEKIAGGGALRPDEEIFLALLSLAGTSLDELVETRLSEDLIAKLERVSNSLSDDIFRYWSQNRNLRVQFRLDAAQPEDPAPFNSGHVFSIRIENTRHRATVRFDERSAGFVWFFSFLVWFSQMTKNFGDRLIILLDEPGTSLHGSAQQDLLRYMAEKIVPDYQVIYTTHSPFMIDASNILSVRTVEDLLGQGDEILGTKVGDRTLSSDSETLFPLHAALGYDLTQSLFIGEHTLVVEGPSDLLYLTWASRQLEAAGKQGLDRRWTIVPAGGIDKIASFVALFSGNALHVAVLTDMHRGDKRKVASLRESEILRQGHVLSAEQYCDGEEADIEDMLGRDFCVALVNRAYDLKGGARLPRARPDDAPPLVLTEVHDHFRTKASNAPEFDHYTPARFLFENWNDLSGHLPGVNDALGRFESLFRDLNGLL